MRIALAAAALLLAAAAQAAPGLFSLTGLDGWQPQALRNKATTAYRVASDGGTRVIEADCRAAASGLIWKQRIDLARTPILAWRWHAEAFPPARDERAKGGDDFALRVYVVRDGGWAFWRTRSLVYAWAARAPAGSDWPSPYTAQAHMVVLRSGPAGWQSERRDVRADFRRYFGLDLDAVDGVAVMTDCDDTGGTARGAYGDLVLGAAPR